MFGIPTRQRVLPGAFEQFNRWRTVPHAIRSRRTIADLSERRKEFESKYAAKLSERVKREGLASIEELKAKMAPCRPEPVASIKDLRDPSVSVQAKDKALPAVRKDASPVKSLSEIMDVQKLLSKDCTPEQVFELWTLYHASLSQGTGRGYLSSTIPSSSYMKMASLAAKYPSFVLPLARPSPEPELKKPAHEFYFLQWSFHESPPHPSHTSSLPFSQTSSYPPNSAPPNPAYSTILFTPLLEYKLRQTFATPHLVLTHYTDLATSHGIVLMRGELTALPSSSERYLLSQVSAGLLANGVQQYYLATTDSGSERRVEMLRRFHEKPTEFYWEELLDQSM